MLWTRGTLDRPTWPDVHFDSFVYFESYGLCWVTEGGNGEMRLEETVKVIRDCGHHPGTSGCGWNQGSANRMTRREEGIGWGHESYYGAQLLDVPRESVKLRTAWGFNGPEEPPVETLHVEKE